MRNSKFFILLLTLAIGFSTVTYGYTDRDILLKKYSVGDIRKALATDDSFMPVPKAGGDFWNNIPDNYKKIYIEKGEKLLGTTWGEMPATLFMQFKRMGNRSNYEAVSFARRSQLNDLVMAEVVENKGRFIDDIINGIWVICEESYWGIPAHYAALELGVATALPNVQDRTVDLFAAETGSLLACAYYLLGDKLDQVEPAVNERLKKEMKERILDPALEKNAWWSGLNRTKVLNNWTPWINSNLLICSFLMEEDQARKVEMVNKSMFGCDGFINSYYDDGACDEGPSYWGRAGASLFEYLELLSLATKDQINIFDNPIVREMGRYIFKSQIKDDVYVNFADASALINVGAPLIYRFGVYTKDEDLKGFAAMEAKRQNLSQKGYGDNLARRIFALAYDKEFMAQEPKAPKDLDYWMDGVQVMIARSTLDPNNSLFVAAKGGHNAESHNHNDIGNFVVYKNGTPILIDAGADTYSAATFSSKRYTLFNNQSQWHNAPTINGFDQLPGLEYRGTNSSFVANDKQATFKVDISKAYPEDAKVKSWMRQVTLNRNKDVVLKDSYQLGEFIAPLVVNFVAIGVPTQKADGVILITVTNPDGTTAEAELLYDSKLFTASFDKKTEFLSRMKSSWNNRPIQRIQLTSKNKSTKGEYTITVKPL